MDEFDPNRLIGLLIDEWGTWHPPTPGRNPQHLWQQNTLRNALVAAISLDTFNRHADKLVMCNIAQIINVLQAMILTQGEQIILTPTYHVFDMYQPHQGGQSLRVSIESDSTSFIGKGEKRSIPVLSGSASLKHGVMTLSITNSHATLPADVPINLRGFAAERCDVKLLTSDDLTAHNTFETPDVVQPQSRQVDVSDDFRFTFAARVGHGPALKHLIHTVASSGGLDYTRRACR